MGSAKVRLGAAALLASTGLASPALAQVATAPPPAYSNVDDIGVDLVSGEFRFALTEAVMGSGEGALPLVRYWGDGGYRDNWSNGLYLSGGKIYVEFGDYSDIFQLSGGTYVSQKGDGATLTKSGAKYTYTARDGTRIDYGATSGLLPLSGFACVQSTSPGTCGVPTKLTRPNGMVFNFNWDFVDRCDNPTTCETGVSYYRFKGVSNTAGYSFTVNYVGNNPGLSGAPPSNWYVKSGVTFANSVTACSGNCPSVTYSTSGTTLTITDALARQWKLTRGTGGLVGIRRPGETSDSTTVAHNSGIVASVTRDGVTTSYSRAVSGNAVTMTITNPLNQQTVVVSDLTNGRATSVKDPLNRTVAYQYDTNGRVTRITQPEANYTQYAYDSRGNLTTVTDVAKPGSGLANIVTSATYAATCTNNLTCNKPDTTTDARGAVTDYDFSPDHGGLRAVRLPAPQSGGIRPRTVFTYSQVTGAAGTPVYKLVDVAACQTTESCSGTADETKVVTAYNSNLLPTSVTRKNGTGTLSATDSMTYDAAGNLLTVNGPLAGTADTTRYRYDAARELIGVVSPDPDGAGALKNRAMRMTYDPAGRVTKQELGTVAGQTDPAWAAFTPAQAVGISYANGRVRTQKLSSGATAYALTQLSYDAAGRPECSAIRMNQAIYGSLPGSACTLGTQGSFGPDRITKTLYDAAGQATQLHVAVGTPAAAIERTLSYTSNGLVQTLTDGANNRTTYEYDGFDRPSKTRFPVTTKGANQSSTTDYEQLTYDVPNNVIWRRLRNGVGIGYAFDALDRLVWKDLPGAEPDVGYAYDNLGRLTYASQPGFALSFGYDALGRQTSESGPQGTVNQAFDLAGRRTQLSTSSGYQLLYQHLVTGEMTAILDANSWPHITFAYDDLGRRTGVSRIFGTTSSWSYDPVSRLSGLGHDFAGTASDVSKSFTHNPALQIAGSTISNDAYTFTGQNVNTAYTANGLNQMTSINGMKATYGATGNMTYNPVSGRSYGYDSEDKLTSASGDVSLVHDPIGRLYQVTSGSGVRRFLYAAGESGLPEPISEYDGAGALVAHYGFGPGPDEPMLWWDVNGASVALRTLHADERGSIVAIGDSAASASAINAYDEYGRPQNSTVAARFGYTGQRWLPEVGLYDYKARMYSPTLGRFMQPDPIGYGDGMNLYAYVGNDPVNFVDPLGLEIVVTFTCGSQVLVNGICRNRPTTSASSGPLTFAPSNIIGGIGGSPGHNTRTESEVCERPLTDSEMKDLLSRFAVPGHEGRPLRSGTHTVWAGGIPGGLVTTTFSRGGLRVTNVTTPAHAFVGQIQRDILVRRDSTWITTSGTGNAQMGLPGGLFPSWDLLAIVRDLANQMSGPTIFRSLDDAAAAYAKAHFEGC